MKKLIIPALLFSYYVAVSFTYGHAFHNIYPGTMARFPESPQWAETQSQEAAFFSALFWPIYWPCHLSRKYWEPEPEPKTVSIEQHSRTNFSYDWDGENPIVIRLDDHKEPSEPIGWNEIVIRDALWFDNQSK